MVTVKSQEASLSHGNCVIILYIKNKMLRGKNIPILVQSSGSGPVPNPSCAISSFMKICCFILTHTTICVALMPTCLSMTD